MKEMIRFVPGSSCEICGVEDESLDRCEMCQAFACSKCIQKGTCMVCMEARCSICQEYLSSRACNECGRLVCEIHGKKVAEATICEVCQAK
jgi:hypothetical protein